jgi:hypothetical protein
MSEWEYRTINLCDLSRNVDALDLLNEAGENGWELVSVSAKNVAYLKRQVSESIPPARLRETKKNA